MSAKIVKTTGRDENNAATEVALAVRTPSAKQKQAAKIVYARAYGEAADQKVKIRQQIDGILRDANLWDEGRQAEFERLRKSLLDGELALERGDGRLLDARKLAISMAEDRAALRRLMSARIEVEQNTADAIAEQAMFNYYVAACTVHADGRHAGKPYFTSDGVAPSVDVYLERGGDRDAQDAAAAVSEMIYGSDDSSVRSLPENKFLLDYGFVDDDLNFIDGEGRRVDSEGRLIDPEGYLVDDRGRRVDAEGRLIDASGRFIVEFRPFLDEDGNPVAPRVRP